MEQLLDLEALVSELDVKAAVWACGSEKLSGMSFTIAFYKNYWEVIK